MIYNVLCKECEEKKLYCSRCEVNITNQKNFKIKIQDSKYTVCDDCVGVIYTTTIRKPSRQIHEFNLDLEALDSQEDGFLVGEDLKVEILQTTKKPFLHFWERISEVQLKITKI